jgi:predicted dehydrogenase
MMVITERTTLMIDLVNDPEIDVIYIATPHSHHYDNVKSALNAGKHVLCEKPFTGTFSSCSV